MRPKRLLCASITILLAISAAAAQESLETAVTQELPSLVETYKMLHANPELSYAEEKTAAFLAKELRALGFEVTERVGKYDQPGLNSYGLVAVMKNGEGPSVWVRTDLDGLPVEEKTGLPYASKVKTESPDGEVPVMHACGHDVHITSLLGTARMLVKMKDRWRGTLVLIGQPAEERGAGAKAMLNDGLYTRFPRPNYVLALHDNASLEAGKVGYVEGFVLAAVNSVDITIRGVGGHGAYPSTTKDPVVLAAQVVLALQTIVSRENSPFDPIVVTVGSINGGTKHNIIPDEVRLQLTVRSYKEEVRRRVLASIERIAKSTAEAAGVPADRLPIVRVREEEFTPATFNNPELTRRVASAVGKEIGAANVVRMEPVMGGEDFGRFSLEGQQIPVTIFWLGAVDPAKVEESRRSGVPLPSLHSPLFAPLPEPTIRTGVRAMTSAVFELMKR
jgi:hippurate hydrolase